MTYTVANVRAIISKYDAPSPAEFFRLLILNSEAVKFGNLGHAFFIQDQEETRNYDSEGDLHYVFKIQSADGGERFFMVEGWYSSMDGRNYYLNDRSPREVKPAAKFRYYTWENA